MNKKPSSAYHTVGKSNVPFYNYRQIIQTQVIKTKRQVNFLLSVINIFTHLNCNLGAHLYRLRFKQFILLFS